jgi:secreted trypsin-like serine protease
MKKIAPLFALVVVLALMTTVASAITWGVPDGGEHPYVGTLLFVDGTGDGYYSCTGTMLNATVMLTAGHCVETEGLPNQATWVSFDERIEIPRGMTVKELERYLNQNWHQVRQVVAHPNYDDFNQFPNTYDVGIVILKHRVNMPAYGQLPALGLLDSVVQDRANRQFTVVGYGMQGVIPAFYDDQWARFKGTVSLVELNSNFNGDDQSAKFTNNPGGGNGSGGTCYGDSGGPVFWGANTVAAVVSWGITPCIGVDYQFRIDTPVAQDFIRPYLR